MSNLKLTPKQIELTEDRIHSDSDLLNKGAEINAQGILIVNERIKSYAKEKMNRYFENQEEASRLRKEKRETEKRITEATLSPEKRKLRETLAGKVQDPRDLYREEIIADLILAKKLEGIMPSHESFRKYFEAVQPRIFNLRDKEEITLGNLLKGTPTSYDMIGCLAEIIGNRKSPKEIELRLNQFHRLFRAGNKFDFDPNNRSEIESYIDVYGNKQRASDADQNKPVVFLKLDDGVYNTFDDGSMGSKFINEAKDELKENNFKKYFELLTQAIGCQDFMYSRFPMIDYIALKALEHDESKRVQIMGGCGDAGCGMSYHIGAIGKSVYGNGCRIVSEEMLEKVREATGTEPGTSFRF